MTLPSSATSLDDNVQLARIRIFFGHASGNMASILVGAILIAVFLYLGVGPLPTLGVWGLFVFAPWMQANVQPVLIAMFGSIPVFSTLFAGPPLGIGIFTAAVI